MFTKQHEKFLLTLYFFNKYRILSNNTSLSKYLNLSKSAISRTSIQLQNAQIIKKQENKNLVLTHEGKELYKELINKYNMLYSFFLLNLNLNQDTAHNDALNCSLYISDETYKKIILQIKLKNSIDKK